MRAPFYCSALAIATIAGLASTANAQQTVYVGGPPPRPGPGPGDDVLIVPPGTMVTVVNGNGTPTPLAPLPPPPLPPPVIFTAPPSVSVSSRPSAWVHLQGGPNLVLEGVLPDQTDWRQMCRGPCDIRVPIDALYRVTSQGMQPSKTVHLATVADGEHVTITVDPTGETTHTMGEALVIVGGVGVLAGGILLYVEALTAGICATPDSGCTGSAGVFWAGVGSAAVGAVGVIAGIKMMQPTSLEQSWGPVDIRERAAARDDHYKRAPMWHDALQAETAPRVTSVPLFSTTF